MSASKRKLEKKEGKDQNWETDARSKGWVCNACGNVLKRDELDLFVGDLRYCTGCHRKQGPTR